MSPSRSDTSLAALLLVQRLVEVDARPLKTSEYWSLLEKVVDPARLLGLGAAAVEATAGVPAAEAVRIARRLDVAPGLAFQLDELHQGGIRLVASVDADYPVRLRERLATGAPPVLHVAGDIGLADGPLLGVVSSRDVRPAGAESAAEVARAAAAHGTGVVSGGAKGVDQIAMRAALGAGAPVVGVLADSLVRGTRDPEARRAIAAGRLCLCTPYPPNAVFTVANAIGRNKVIYALSTATLVVAADVDRGATWAGAVEALRRHTTPVLAWQGPGCAAGNGELIRDGAWPIASVDELFPLPSGDLAPAGPTVPLGV